MKNNQPLINLKLQLLQEAEERKEFLKKIGVTVEPAEAEPEAEPETKGNPIQEKTE